MKWLILILSCLSCAAQHPLMSASGVDWTRVGSGAWKPSSLPTLGYWWVSSDLTNNNIVTNWIDRIQAATWTQSVSARRPTNNVLGVTFDNSIFLTNANPFFLSATNDTLFILLTVYAMNNSFQDVLVNDNTEVGWVWETGLDLIARNYAPIGVKFPAIGKSWDFLQSHSGQNYVIYTNGIQAGALVGFTTGYINKFNFKEMGADTVFLNDAFQGRIQEVGVFTNYAMTAGDVANLHKYFTNTYPGDAISP